MSRAFVREPDGDAAETPLPDRPLSTHPNYVTERGLAELRGALQALERERDALRGDDSLGAKQQLGEIERDRRYVLARLASAQLVPAAVDGGVARIGSRVEVADEHGATTVYAIVGEDEADAARGLVSWVSPLAKALLGHEAGEVVRWERPDGALELEILAVRRRAGPV